MMKFIDLQYQYSQIKSNIDARIQRVLNHGQYIMGPEITELEQSLAKYVGVKHCLSVSSGTAALQLALMALDIGPDDEVITTAFSFFATAEMIILLGAKPVFVDIDLQTYNVDPSLLEAAITSKTKAIMPVSLFGQCANLKVINQIAQKHGLPVIEDGAQSFGATHHGQRSCSMTEIACTSFFPSKPLGCYGDGGACFTNHDELAEKIVVLRNHGQQGRYNHTHIGLNARLDTLQAAILLEKMCIFEQEVGRRQQVAQWYIDYLKGEAIVPFVEPQNTSVFAQFTVRLRDRDNIAAALKQRGIPTAVHYPVSLEKQPALQQRYHDIETLSNSELAAQGVLSLPFHPYMTKQVVRQVCDELLSVLVDQSVNG